MQPVAISVDSPEESRSLRQKVGYTYPFLSDANIETIRRYGIVDRGAGIYQNDIARPAEFLVDRAGFVRWRNLTGDLRVRARPDQMLEAARLLR